MNGELSQFSKVAILMYLGYFLLILGALSGIVLFIKASINKGGLSGVPNVSTLWGLFIICLAAGIIIIAVI